MATRITFICDRCKSEHEMSPVEKQTWIEVLFRQSSIQPFKADLCAKCWCEVKDFITNVGLSAD